jgi:hypothetical protein
MIGVAEKLMPCCSRCGTQYEYDAATMIVPGDDPRYSGTFHLCDCCRAFTRPAGVAS